MQGLGSSYTPDRAKPPGRAHPEGSLAETYWAPSKSRHGLVHVRFAFLMQYLCTFFHAWWE